MDTILLIKSLPLTDELNNLILINYKYECLEKKYKLKYKDLNKHLLYYIWLRKQLIKKKKINNSYSLLKIIKEYDIY